MRNLGVDNLDKQLMLFDLTITREESLCSKMYPINQPHSFLSKLAYM